MLTFPVRNGITSTHVAFIKRGHVIILCFAVQPGQPIPLELAAVVFAVGDNKPCIIVVCSSPADIQETIPFPTVIQTTGYTPPALEATADLIFGEHVPGIGRQPGLATGSAPQSRRWMVEQWNEARDMADVLNLWTENVSSRFSLDHQTFAFLLRRPGYAKHYVVRYPRSDEILGFCATYLSYADREGENLIASLAILLVRRQSRNQGVGLSLHNHAIDQLRRTRGVIRVQLGSTFPRILYGPPVAMQMDEEWFQRRGWQLNMDVPGQGRAVHDVILDFVDWQHVPATASSSSSMRFRLCVQEDMDRVLALVDETSTRLARMGWFDQYSSLMNGPNVKDIVIGLENNVIVAAALTYTPSCGSQIASNLPWAGRAGDDVGGVACICISCECVFHCCCSRWPSLHLASWGPLYLIS
jgi:GNAT superfamily N-acetyltransferase